MTHFLLCVTNSVSKSWPLEEFIFLLSIKIEMAFSFDSGVLLSVGLSSEVTMPI